MGIPMANSLKAAMIHQEKLGLVLGFFRKKLQYSRKETVGCRGLFYEFFQDQVNHFYHDEYDYYPFEPGTVAVLKKIFQ